MPRQARLDAPGTLHHVILRGAERGAIVRDDADRQAFVRRLAHLADVLKTPVYAWALLRNHAHLLLRSGPAGLPRFMRRLLTGYAVNFNRRHRRAGHLFQDRYKSIVCEEDPYFRELVRYIHLNPLRAGLVRTLAELGSYAWSGHAALLGRQPQPWVATEEVLGWFGESPGTARPAYLRFVAEAPRARRPDLVGGGLVRSLGGWAAVQTARSRGVATVADPRILGQGEFVEHLIAEADSQHAIRTMRQPPADLVARRIREACRAAGASEQELRAGSRRRPAVRLRLMIARELVTDLGLSLAAAARELGVTTSAICRLLQPGSRASAGSSAGRGSSTP